MRYWVSLNGNEYEVTVNGRSVSCAGKSLDAGLTAEPGSPMVVISIDGRERRVGLVRGKDGIDLYYRGRRLRARVEDQRARALRQVAGQRGGTTGGLMRAPMPGLVLRLMVEAGTVVQEGTPVLVLEAMKMENEIRAHTAGRIRGVRVTAGEPVEKGAPLVEIEPETA